MSARGGWIDAVDGVRVEPDTGSVNGREGYRFAEELGGGSGWGRGGSGVPLGGVPR